MKKSSLTFLLIWVLMALATPVVNVNAAANDAVYFRPLSDYYMLRDNNIAGVQQQYKLWTNNGTMTVSGKVWSTTYTISKGRTFTPEEEIIRYYSGEIAKKNGTLIFDDRDDAARRDITGKFFNSDNKLVWVEIVAWNGGDDYKITWIETQ